MKPLLAQSKHNVALLLLSALKPKHHSSCMQLLSQHPRNAVSHTAMLGDEMQLYQLKWLIHS